MVSASTQPFARILRKSPGVAGNIPVFGRLRAETFSKSTERRRPQSCCVSQCRFPSSANTSTGQILFKTVLLLLTPQATFWGAEQPAVILSPFKTSSRVCSLSGCVLARPQAQRASCGDARLTEFPGSAATTHSQQPRRRSGYCHLMTRG